MTRNARGFSLVELMVAMTVTLIVSGAIYGLLTSGSNAFRREPEIADRQQNIRAAMDLIARDVFSAGAALPTFGQVFTRADPDGTCLAALNGCGAAGAMGAPAAAGRGGDAEETDVLEILAADEQCPMMSVCSTTALGGSAGNFVTLSTILEKGYEALDYRFFCLGAHYRTQLAFTWEALDAARAGRRGLRDRMAQLREEAPQGPEAPTGGAAEHLAGFEAHAADDLNMPNCLADLWMLLRDSAVSPAHKLGAALRMDEILGLGLASAKKAEVTLDEDASRLLAEREQARKARDWKRADELRAALLARGIEIQDGPQGPKLRFAAGQKGENPVTSEG